MPLETASTYSQTLLRTDGRRWNELRRISASISTQASSDGSSQFTVGNTIVVCTVTGPREGYVGREESSISADEIRPDVVNGMATMLSSRLR